VTTDTILRPYRPADEEPSINLWQRSWAATYPDIDFASRVPWWRTRWRDELLPAAHVIVAEADGILIGYVTVDPATHYLDQLVVAPEAWGTRLGADLMVQAKMLSPGGLVLHVNQDNARAVGFYKKHGFAIAAEEANPISSRATYRMEWKA
jgi:putative acetyltransferase